MTPKQEAFAREYLIDLNATQAAIRAGYSAKTAYSAGERLLKNVEVSEAVQTSMDRRAEINGLTADYVINGIREVAERCMERAPVMIGRGDSREQAIDEEGRHLWTFDATGANKAFELLGKHLKLFTDKVEHSGEVALTVAPEDAAL